MSLLTLEEKKIWTYEDYCSLSEDDLTIYEIIEGELFMAPAPNIKHQRVLRNLFRIMDRYVLEKALGEILFAPCDVVFSEINVLQPDILFISKENQKILTEKNIQGSPDLVVEIISFGTARKDRINKMRVYARFGVRHVWLIDPDSETIEAFQLDEQIYRIVALHQGEEEFMPLLFSGLVIPLKALFLS
jgi:Uma2 family endonuclease